MRLLMFVVCALNKLFAAKIKTVSLTGYAIASLEVSITA